ncbi:hypothetical protein B0H16DRAFT_1459172 [Mycena metata]|uniref:Uncharacterized protein n=1 Tax=Mycena metata TaxID=1033252 RepID=A0AAD7J1Z7_9AGAR|nr:hypothetical protein B0H16DRAFT_1459172 [Mycena metata]
MGTELEGGLEGGQKVSLPEISMPDCKLCSGISGWLVTIHRMSARCNTSASSGFESNRRLSIQMAWNEQFEKKLGFILLDSNGQGNRRTYLASARPTKDAYSVLKSTSCKAIAVFD